MIGSLLRQQKIQRVEGVCCSTEDSAPSPAACLRPGSIPSRRQECRLSGTTRSATTRPSAMRSRTRASNGSCGIVSQPLFRSAFTTNRLPSSTGGPLPEHLRSQRPSGSPQTDSAPKIYCRSDGTKRFLSRSFRALSTCARRGMNCDSKIAAESERFEKRQLRLPQSQCRTHRRVSDRRSVFAGIFGVPIGRSLPITLWHSWARNFTCNGLSFSVCAWHG